MLPYLNALALVAVLLGQRERPRISEAHERSVVQSWHLDGYIFTLSEGRGQWVLDPDYVHPTVVKRRLAATGSDSTPAAKYDLYSRPTPLTWKLSSNCLWGAALAVLFEELYLLDQMNDNRDEQFAAKYHPGQGLSIRPTMVHYVFDDKEPVNGARDTDPKIRAELPRLGTPGGLNEVPYDRGGLGGAGVRPIPLYNHYDVVPMGRRKALLFVHYRGKLQVWEGKGDRTGPYKDWEVAWKRLEKEEFATTFREPFMAFERNGTYYFLTHRGKLYIVEKAEPGKRTMKPLWIDERLPVRFMVGDADTQRYFLFGLEWPIPVDRKYTKGVWFEVKPEVKPEELNPSLLDKLSGNDTTRISIECARFLVEKKQLGEKGK
jgi:hypothetical protein